MCVQKWFLCYLFMSGYIKVILIEDLDAVSRRIDLVCSVLEWSQRNYPFLFDPSASHWLSVLLRESALRTTSSCREVHPQERSSRLNTHSFSCSPSPHRQETMLDKHSHQKNSLFPPIIESNVEWGRRQNVIILYTLAFGEAHWAISVRGRWANFRATCANTNNCSGSPSLSALEVCVESFKAPQPISLSPVFPLVWFVLIQDPSQSFIAYAVRA